MSSIGSNLQELEHHLHEVVRQAGRKRSSLQLLAVSKTFSPQAVSEAHYCGQKSFGENRVQEAASKIPLCPRGIKWHLIGPLQANKARKAVQIFDVIQTLDRPKIIHKTGRAAEDLGKKMRVYLQVNVGGEVQKHGASPSDLPSLLEALEKNPSLQLEGIMCIPPYDPDPERTRPFFRQVRSLLEKINHLSTKPIDQLSMGMSRDYVIAIQEGATLIRIGTGIFGPRGMR